MTDRLKEIKRIEYWWTEATYCDNGRHMDAMRDIRYLLDRVKVLEKVREAGEDFLIITRVINEDYFGYPKWVEIGLDFEKALAQAEETEGDG